jgi:hypothetical protein
MKPRLYFNRTLRAWQLVLEESVWTSSSWNLLWSLLQYEVRTSPDGTVYLYPPKERV